MLEGQAIDAIRSIAIALTSTEGLVVWCSFIVVVALGFFAAFRWKIGPLVRELKSANRRLWKTDGMEGFAASFQELNEEFSKSPRLRHSWREFAETLLFPGSEIDEEEGVIHNTHAADAYFSRDRLIGSTLNLRFYNALPNMLTGLGILGTFVGLVCGIYLATGGLASNDIAEARSALSRLLDGAAFAFGTSIAGLLSSILFSAREKHWVHVLDQLLSEWIVGIDSRVRRLPPERIQALTHREAKEQTRLFRTFTNDLAFSIAKVVDDQIRQPLTGLMEKLIEGVDALRQDRAKSDEETLKQLLGQFSASLTGAAGREMQAFGATLGRMNESFSTQMGAMAQSQQELIALTEKTLAALTQCVTDIGRANVDTQNILREAARLIDLVRSTEQQLLASIAPLENVASSFAGASEATKAAASGIEGSCAKLEAGVAQLTGLQSEVKKVWADYATRFESIDGALSNVFAQLEEGLSSYSESISKYVLEIEKQAGSVVRDLAGAAKDLSESVEELHEALEKSA